jgi:Response regulator containing a CheY-like receiver domain and an HTH DNA-binding domain
VKASTVAAIAEVGSIVADAVRQAADPASIWEPLRRIASFDAAMISIRDPLTGQHQPLTNKGYEEPLLRFINREYLSCHSYDVARARRKPIRMQDVGPSFYQTRVYREFLADAGYREGFTLVLRSGGERGRITGLMTMSFGEARAADCLARRGLELVAPVLGRLVDVSRNSTWLTRMLESNAAAYMVDSNGNVIPAGPGDTPIEPSAVTISACRRLLASSNSSLVGYGARREGETWERVHIVRLPDIPPMNSSHVVLMIRHAALPHGITERELEVLTLISRGMSNREIGARLHISPRTIGRHVEHLLLKTGRANRSALASYAVEEGVIKLGL